MVRHIQNPGIFKTVYPSIFKDIQGCLGILMHIQPHPQARDQGRKERHPRPFLKIEKRVLIFVPDSVHLWIKYFIQNVVLRGSTKKKLQNVSLRSLFFQIFDEVSIELPQFLLPRKLCSWATTLRHYSFFRTLHLKCLTVF